jgi:hypothetical protein
MGLADFATVKPREQRNFPGPGQYAVKSCFGDSSRPAPTLKARQESKPSRLVGTSDDVGPGRYDVPGTMGAGVKMGFSGPRPPQRSDQSELGPKYDVTHGDMASMQSSPRWSMGTKHRAPAATATQGPGPIYAVKTTLKDGGKSFGMRCSTKASEPRPLGPGPGGYDVPRFGDKLPKQQRITSTHGFVPRAPQAPGPGEYDVVNGTVADKTTPRGHRNDGAMMPGRNFPPLAAPCGPGPAGYDNPLAMGSQSARGSQAKGVSILRRFEDYHDMDDIYPRPAPGDYVVPSAFQPKANKGFSFGNKLADPAPNTVAPGPGEYDVSAATMAGALAASKQGVFFNADKAFDDGVKVSSARHAAKPEPTEEKRAAILRAERRAGARGTPTLYPAIAHKKAPAFTMTGKPKHAEAPEAAGPGPGTYDLYKYETTGTGTSFYRGAFKREDGPSAAPGPGQYDDEAAFKSTRSARSTTMSAKAPPSF